MGRLATRADFEGLAHGRPARMKGAALLGAVPPPHLLGVDGDDYVLKTWMYDDYRWTEDFPRRADRIRELYPRARTVLVAGAGFGFLVDELMKRKVDAYGFDASPYAVAKAREVLPTTIAERVMLVDVADCTVGGVAGMAAFRRARVPRRGIPGIDLVVSEDLLPCAGDEAEARLWVENLRNLSERVLHLCTPRSEANNPGSAHLWWTHAAWAAFCAPDPVLCTECLGVAQTTDDGETR